MTTKFNCGKMFHIFIDNEEGHYINEFTDDEAKVAFLEGRAFLKIHGECCAVVFRNEAWGFWMRRDTKNKVNRKEKTIEYNEHFIKLPEGGNISEYTSTGQYSNTKHRYSLKYLEPDFRTKKDKTIGSDTYDCIQTAIAKGIIPQEAPEGTCVTVEWVGQKHQGNIDNISNKHALAFHHAQVLSSPIRALRAFKELARTKAFEGFIYEHPVTGQLFKLRCSKIKENLWDSCQTTDIKPAVC